MLKDPELVNILFWGDVRKGLGCLLGSLAYPYLSMLQLDFGTTTPVDEGGNIAWGCVSRYFRSFLSHLGVKYLNQGFCNAIINSVDFPYIIAFGKYLSEQNRPIILGRDIWSNIYAFNYNTL